MSPWSDEPDRPRWRIGWLETLVCDDFSGCKAMFELGITEAGCLAHARRKFHELWANHKSAVGEDALKFFVQLH
ncbi:IS66 family transposase [Rhizobacter fulvus]